MDNREIVNAVQRMQAYIEEHLQEPITLHKLASAAGYSPWHAAKNLESSDRQNSFRIYSRRAAVSSCHAAEGRRCQDRGCGIRFRLRLT